MCLRDWFEMHLLGGLLGFHLRRESAGDAGCLCIPRKRLSGASHMPPESISDLLVGCYSIRRLPPGVQDRGIFTRLQERSYLQAQEQYLCQTLKPQATESCPNMFTGRAGVCV